MIRASIVGLVSASAGMTALADSLSSPSDAAFARELVAESRHASIPVADDIYAPLLGAWDIKGREHVPPAAPITVRMRVHFARTLGGRAIQDVWIWPIKAEAPDGELGRGTTLRIYDPQTRGWDVHWFDPVDRKRAQLKGSKVGSDLVHLGVAADGHQRRWTFTDVTVRSFTWRGETSTDGGRTWFTTAQYFATRAP